MSAIITSGLEKIERGKIRYNVAGKEIDIDEALGQGAQFLLKVKEYTILFTVNG